MTADPALAFIGALHRLEVPLWSAPPGRNGKEFDRPAGWQHRTVETNLDVFRREPRDCVAGNMGGALVVLDGDTRNGCDVAAVEQALDGAGVRVYGRVDTPGGGRHWYLAGHPDLPTIHATAERPAFIGYPGVEVISYGANVFLPGTSRPKYGGRGYEVVANDLEVLVEEGGDEESAENLVAWVRQHRAAKVETFEPAVPWSGDPPDHRQRAYLDATVRNVAARIAAMGPDSGRNVAVYEGGLCLGNYVAGAGLEEAAAVDALLDAARACGLVADDGEASVLASIRSGLRNGRVRPRAVPADPLAAMLPSPPVAPTAEPEVSVASLLDVVTAADVEIRRVRYLWEGRIPLGAMTLMPGEEGIGKTTVGIRLMSDLTRGVLRGEHYGTPRDVIVLAAEDGLADVIVPRLHYAGADMSRVHIVRARLDMAGDPSDVIVPRDLSVLSSLVRQKDAALVWIDSLATALPDELKSIAYKDTAKVLRAVGSWAEQERVAVVAPWHLNKASGSDTAVRIMDSRAFRTAVRAMLLVVADPDAEEGVTQGIVALDKANAGTLAIPALRYRIRRATYMVDEVDERTGEVCAVEASCGVAEWIGEVAGDGRAIARDALTPALDRADDPAVWLRAYLADHGEAERSSIISAAAEAGFSRASIVRAAPRVGVHTRSINGRDPQTGRPFRRAAWSLRSSSNASSSRLNTAPSGLHTHTTESTESTGEGDCVTTERIYAGHAQSTQSTQSTESRGDWEPRESTGRGAPGCLTDGCSTCGGPISEVRQIMGHPDCADCANCAEAAR